MYLDKGNYGSPRWTYEILDCAMPMTFDTYSNCAHQCLYCFSFFQRAVGSGADDYLHHKVRSVDVERVKRMFTDPDKHAGQFKNYIKRRMTLQWGGLSDGFDWYEKKFGKSLELLQFFREIDYPLSISTKGVWFVDDERYRKVLKGAKNVHWKYSIITDNEEHVAKLEPGVPSAAARFLALKKLGELGCPTTLRFRPFVLGTSEHSIDSMFESARDAGCYSVTTEFLGWESRASNTSLQRLEMMSKVLGYDVMKFYRDNSAHASGLLRLNYDLKRPYITRMKEKAKECGLKFFVSDAHHKEDSFHAGCCGLPSDGPLSNVNRGQYAEAILIAKKNGVVKWSDIAEDARSLLSDVELTAAEGFNIGTTGEKVKRVYQSVFDYMHDIWNNPKSWQSPARYFGGALVPGQTDENGDIVYVYNKPFIENGLQLNTVNAIAKEFRMTGKDNADRYDEMTADGGNFGHVAYPVFVFSRKRWANATTMRLLDASKINYTLVVSDEDYDQYADVYNNADILVLPNEAKGIRGARQFVIDRCREEGYPYCWMLDDDIQSITSKDPNLNSLRSLFSTLEVFVEDYSNISLIGVDNAEEIFKDKEFAINQPIRGLFLMNLQIGFDFEDPEMKVELYEDLAFAMKTISNGFVTVQHNKFQVQYAGHVIGGGASNLYNQLDMQLYCAKVLNSFYPKNTSIAHQPAPLNGSLVVNWKSFNSTIQSRNVEKLMEKSTGAR